MEGVSNLSVPWCFLGHPQQNVDNFLGETIFVQKKWSGHRPTSLGHDTSKFCSSWWLNQPI